MEEQVEPGLRCEVLPFSEQRTHCAEYTELLQMY